MKEKRTNLIEHQMKDRLLKIFCKQHNAYALRIVNDFSNQFYEAMEKVHFQERYSLVYAMIAAYESLRDYE